jgi:hypothetical protein
MKTEKCECEKPIFREHSEWKGSSESYCDRCKRPIGLRAATIPADTVPRL